MSRKATKEYIGMKGRAYKAASRLLRNIHDLFPEAELSRSRAYHSNDNAHVEEKNRHVGRELFGERRLVCRYDSPQTPYERMTAANNKRILFLFAISFPPFRLEIENFRFLDLLMHAPIFRYYYTICRARFQTKGLYKAATSYTIGARRKPCRQVPKRVRG